MPAFEGVDNAFDFRVGGGGDIFLMIIYDIMWRYFLLLQYYNLIFVFSYHV